jgi:heptose I phosphotransferase
MPPQLRKALAAGEKCDTFERAMNLEGKAYRNVPGRKTIRIELLNEQYFIKQHFGVGWGEIFKNLFSLKKPILSAMTEVRAIKAISALGIATTPLIAYGQRGWNPAKLESFVMTKDLGDIISLESLCVEWKTKPPDATFKRNLIIAVARVAKKIHENGMNHRDFYLCHFCLNNSDLKSTNLYLIDLHRMLIYNKPSKKANMKDIAALYFSAMDIGLTAKDYLRFKMHYQKQTIDFWKQVDLRAVSLYAKFNSIKFQKKLSVERTKLD